MSEDLVSPANNFVVKFDSAVYQQVKDTALRHQIPFDYFITWAVHTYVDQQLATPRGQAVATGISTGETKPQRKNIPFQPKQIEEVKVFLATASLERVDLFAMCFDRNSHEVVNAACKGLADAMTAHLAAEMRSRMQVSFIVR